jgi:hypothetical protein
MNSQMHVLASLIIQSSFSNHDALDLIKAHFVLSPIAELRPAVLA